MMVLHYTTKHKPNTLKPEMEHKLTLDKVSQIVKVLKGVFRLV